MNLNTHEFWLLFNLAAGVHTSGAEIWLQFWCIFNFGYCEAVVTLYGGDDRLTEWLLCNVHFISCRHWTWNHLDKQRRHQESFRRQSLRQSSHIHIHISPRKFCKATIHAKPCIITIHIYKFIIGSGAYRLLAYSMPSMAHTFAGLRCRLQVKFVNCLTERRILAHELSANDGDECFGYESPRKTRSIQTHAWIGNDISVYLVLLRPNTAHPQRKQV